MTVLRGTISHRDDGISTVDVSVPVKPSGWTTEDAQQVLWGLIGQLEAQMAFTVWT